MHGMVLVGPSARRLEVGELLPKPAPRVVEKCSLLDALRAFAAQFSARELRYLLRVVKVVMDRR